MVDVCGAKWTSKQYVNRLLLEDNVSAFFTTQSWYFVQTSKLPVSYLEKRYQSGTLVACGYKTLAKSCNKLLLQDATLSPIKIQAASIVCRHTDEKTDIKQNGFVLINSNRLKSKMLCWKNFVKCYKCLSDDFYQSCRPPTSSKQIFMLNMATNKLECTVVVIGDSRVGKTSLIRRITKGAFSQVSAIYLVVSFRMTVYRSL